MTIQAHPDIPHAQFTPSLTEEDARQQAKLLSMLADATRLRILTLLSERARQHKVIHGEQIAAALDRKPSGIAHHLATLVEAGLVEARSDGLYKCYSINKSALRKAVSIIELAGDLYE